MKRILVEFEDPGCGSTGLSPRLAVAKLSATSSPRGGSGLSRRGSSDAAAALTSFALEPPRIPVGESRLPRSPRAKAHPAPVLPSPFTLEPARRNVTPPPPPPSGARLGTASAAAPPKAAADDEWSTVPTRRGGKKQVVASSGAGRHSGDGGGGDGFDEDDDGDHNGLLEHGYERGDRNPQGKKSNQYFAVLKREGSVAKRATQRGGPKR
ncbi:hypothetical protein T492DRAFT_1022646 [Pavlovales sp. CCMP2436]|nr:hypothetical protein T492DRAFT_1022646 [Pavlovales sp. CCMP2436]|mmetsp:Transcript_4467/g.11439  ORF Transcript_4467/g.11439 Transcript_4467/m.11439 type:complete len:210 (-) Transcript_4467:31-660(-)|eukprot:CAMPEP_0179861882 /NCGR_PEP_ID=MMETSP0982-20121206/14519_1 /TAXON_ID=483367 /ORGANISM="non described non described, Strain CCMP 2436" /LENGTH=209 /DNA_ID=CAMNT_0021749495 /DNA_START=81 /DNA_END=710 /DNA_ORIENTATION=+